MSCRNCGAELTGEFCARCGQRDVAPNPTVREFLHEAAEEFLHWDGKLLGTFRLLATRPGALTREYLAGRRIRYISPLRVYLTCSVLYFFVSAFVPKTIVISTGGPVTTDVGPIKITQSDTTAVLAGLDTVAAHSTRVRSLWARQLGRALRNRSELSRLVTSTVPKTMFVLVPLFAGIVAIVMRSRQRRYPQHLAFALHVHALLFLALVLGVVGRTTPSDALRMAIQTPILVFIGWYLVVALRVVYGGSWRGTIGRAGLITAVYVGTFIAAMLLMFALIVLFAF